MFDDGFHWAIMFDGRLCRHTALVAAELYYYY